MSERGLPYPLDDDQAAQEFIGRTVNMRQPHPRVWPQLLADDRVEQTFRALAALKNDAQARFTKRRADLEVLRVAKNRGEISLSEYGDAEHEHRLWHARASRFDQAVAKRLREARAALKDRNRRVVTEHREKDELDHWKALLADLAEAVHHHQDAIHPDDASPEDRLLWSRLDLVALPGDHGGVLRDLIRKRIARAERERTGNPS